MTTMRLATTANITPVCQLKSRLPFIASGAGHSIPATDSYFVQPNGSGTYSQQLPLVVRMQ